MHPSSQAILIESIDAFHGVPTVSDIDWMGQAGRAVLRSVGVLSFRKPSRYPRH